MDDMLMIMGALHRGIIPPDFCIDDALAALSEEEARVAKRKFRKMVRKMKREHGTNSEETVTVSARRKRSWVKRECFRIGRELVGTVTPLSKAE